MKDSISGVVGMPKMSMTMPSRPKPSTRYTLNMEVVAEKAPMKQMIRMALYR